MRVRSENYVLSWGVCRDGVAVTNHSGVGRRGALLRSLPSLLLALIGAKESSSRACFNCLILVPTEGVRVASHLFGGGRQSSRAKTKLGRKIEDDVVCQCHGERAKRAHFLAGHQGYSTKDRHFVPWLNG